jgi:hypothetical protein
MGGGVAVIMRVWPFCQWNHELIEKTHQSGLPVALTVWLDDLVSKSGKDMSAPCLNQKTTVTIGILAGKGGGGKRPFPLPYPFPL